MELNKLEDWENELLLKCLKELEEHQSNRGYETTVSGLVNLLPDKTSFDRIYNEYNNSPGDHDPCSPHIHNHDFAYAGYLIYRLTGKKYKESEAELDEQS